MYRLIAFWKPDIGITPAQRESPPSMGAAWPSTRRATTFSHTFARSRVGYSRSARRSSADPPVELGEAVVFCGVLAGHPIEIVERQFLQGLAIL
jgi:hypothetical protein